MVKILVAALVLVGLIILAGRVAVVVNLFTGRAVTGEDDNHHPPVPESTPIDRTYPPEG